MSQISECSQVSSTRIVLKSSTILNEIADNFHLQSIDEAGSEFIFDTVHLCDDDQKEKLANLLGIHPQSNDARHYFNKQYLIFTS